MPDIPEILGFSNRWYVSGITHAKQIKLPNGLSVRCLTLPYFLASKLEAFKSRGMDYRMSHDIEDIILVLDGKLDFAELHQGPDDVSEYLHGQFQTLLADDAFQESIFAHLAEDSSGDTGRVKRILEALRSM